MAQTMVRYTVKPDEAARNEEFVRNVFAELDEHAPAGVHYAAFVLDDGVSFVHVASTDAEDGRNPLLEVAAFRAYLDGIGARSEQPPEAVRLREVGSFGFWGG